MAQFFASSSNTKIGDHPVFQNVSGDVNNVSFIHKCHHQSQSSTSLAGDEGETLT
ncbi:hypothetical protein V5O48_014683, partial [Marasmius crinis-equi]